VFLADKHNFGQEVKRVQQGTDALPCFYFEKPRSVYWEWLFFGQSSPLRDIFCSKGRDQYKPLSHYLFNLEVEILEKWRGRSREVVEWPGAITNEHFYAFGALVAYCYIFGIRDLHKQNLIKTETHFQAVDVEVVFTQLVLPSETLLLPFKHIGYELAGIGVFANGKSEHTSEQKQEILNGYLDLFDLVIKKKKEIDVVLSSQDLRNHPIRVIVRNTSEYRNIFNSLPANILESEITQLSRGDIPFYFKYAGNPELFWLKEKSFESTAIPLEGLKKDIDRHAEFYTTGWCDAGVTEKMLASGYLYLNKFFEISGESNAFTGKSALYRVSLVSNL
tara:strand:- start:60815 stop:61816 length:1002 start_codon:yes stop_codon:yes gene_type:complete